MTPEDILLVKHRMARASETLAEAKVLLESGYTTGVVNRLYYACFYFEHTDVEKWFHKGMRSLKQFQRG
jgi:uncharacterized protein (UPF0332 family)